MALSSSTHQLETEGFVDFEGEGFYAIPHVDRLGPFLMSIVSDSDHWMFVSSLGGLAAGRRDPTLSLFPYETDDRLHHAYGVTGPITIVRTAAEDGTWAPLSGIPSADIQRNLYKSVAGNKVIFEEVHRGLDLAFRYRWSNSDRYGFVRTATLHNFGSNDVTIRLLDGLLNLLPFGVNPAQQQATSNLINAYKRSEIIDAASRLAVYSLESRVVDRPEPAESLGASVAWSAGLDRAQLTVDPEAVNRFRRGIAEPAVSPVTGKPGAYLLLGDIELEPDEETRWTIVADVNQSQDRVVDLLNHLGASDTTLADVTASIRSGSTALVAMMAAADGLQRTGDRVATAHHFANVMYNVMRGGVFTSGTHVDRDDFLEYLESRNGAVALRHRSWLDGLSSFVDRAQFGQQVHQHEDPQLKRLYLDYLPLTFSRRHGDPSRPWNEFSIRVRDPDGAPIVYYEGNWRDIFQNWEALCLSFPEFLPHVVSVFLNASTAEGFNPYRITSTGIDWEVPEPDNPWSNIGYWGDHQIVYLHRLLETTNDFLPGTVRNMLDRAWFSYADSPYRLAPYEDLVANPKATIRYDATAADNTASRVEAYGQDGSRMWTADNQVHLVTMVEKLLVPALSKLSNFVPGGGIWMNTQRPEWNDANNALVGHGLSMVTLCHLRSYLKFLASVLRESDLIQIDVSTQVDDWMTAIFDILEKHGEHLGGELTDARRKEVLDGLGRAFSEYRSTLYAKGLSGAVPVAVSAILDLCRIATAHLDDTIRRNRRSDGLYHSYNLIHFDADGSSARIEHLYEMLEGQVAVISSGLLSSQEKLDVLESLFDSSIYRPDQQSFMLYPARRPPAFLEKNVIPDSHVTGNPLLSSLLAAGDVSVILVDRDGRHRFNPAFLNVSDLEAALVALAADEHWNPLVSSHHEATVDTYEQVFGHHGHTGRSGSMYGYEGIGSIYWHMVAKLLVATQEAVFDAETQGSSSDVLHRLIEMYWRIRSGLGFEKTASEFGAFPIDAYSHTPAHAGAQQPGMTGQVKEEIITRIGELGVRVSKGNVRFETLLLRQDEFLTETTRWQIFDLEGHEQELDLPAGSLGFTFCGLPVVYRLTDDQATVSVLSPDGQRTTNSGIELGDVASRVLFRRSGEIIQIEVEIPSTSLAPPRETT